MPGVLGVFTGADCLADGLEADPARSAAEDQVRHEAARPRAAATVFIGPHMLLPADKARHVGEAVAMVVAETEAQALDAAEAVEVDYEVLPFVLHAEDAHGAGRARWCGTRCRTTSPVDTLFGDRGATDAAFAAADHVVAMDFHIGRVTGVPMEPRAALADYDAETGRYTLYAGSGGAVRQKRELAGVLGIAPDQLRVLSYDVGGNFGTRNRVFVEFGLVLWAARQARPAGQIHGDALGGVPERLSGPRPRHQGRARAAQGRPLPRACAPTNISNVGARCVSLSPLGKGSG